MSEKIGVYVCHCGSNIASVVDVEEVARWAKENFPDVAVSRDYKYMCSSPGQELIENDKIQNTKWFQGFGKIKSKQIVKAVEDLKDRFGASPIPGKV